MNINGILESVLYVKNFHISVMDETNTQQSKHCRKDVFTYDNIEQLKFLFFAFNFHITTDSKESTYLHLTQSLTK